MEYRIDGRSTKHGTTFYGPNWAVTVTIEGKPIPKRLKLSGEMNQHLKKEYTPMLIAISYDLLTYSSIPIVGFRTAFFFRIILTLIAFIQAAYSRFFNNKFCQWHAAEHYALNGVYVDRSCGSNYCAWVIISSYLFFPLSVAMYLVHISINNRKNKILEFINRVGGKFQSLYAVCEPSPEIQSCANKAYNMLVLLEDNELPSPGSS